MKKDIYPTWCTEYTLSYEEILAESSQTWRDRLVDRGLIVLKGLPSTLSDAEFHEICKKFGVLWTVEDYNRGSGTVDKTLNKETIANPTSYFKTTNHFWKGGEMKYHADMAHVGEKSFPARALYMVKTAKDNSGATEWLNLELAWEQFTEEEKAYYSDVEVYQHFMYEPGTRLEKFPFLKINPYNGKPSPRVNCYGKGLSWVHHVAKAGEEIEEYKKLEEFIEGVYRLAESKPNTLYRHVWDNGDILIYDNWFSVHRRDSVHLVEGEGDRLLKRLSFNIYQ